MHGGIVIERGEKGFKKIIDKKTGEDVTPGGGEKTPEEIAEQIATKKESAKKDATEKAARLKPAIERFEKETREKYQEKRDVIL